MFNFEEESAKMDKEFNRRTTQMFVMGCLTSIFWVVLISVAIIGVTYVILNMVRG